VEEIVTHESPQRFADGPRLFTEAVVYGSDAAEIVRRLERLEESDGLGTAPGQELPPISTGIRRRVRRSMANVHRVVVRLPIRNVREIRSDRAPIGPGGEVVVRGIPIDRALRCCLEFRYEIFAGTGKKTNREIDIGNSRRLEVRRK
jgi:hypothetical protein